MKLSDLIIFSTKDPYISYIMEESDIDFVLKSFINNIADYKDLHSYQPAEFMKIGLASLISVR